MGDQNDSRVKKSDGYEVLFVIGVWLLLSLAGVAVIAKWGCDVPKRDDWFGVTHLASGKSLPALIMRKNDYRAPASVAAWWALWHMAPGKLPQAMLVGFAVLSLEVLATIFVIRSIFGKLAYSDAVFPLALLHLGHAVNFLWWEQAWAVAAFGLLALLIVVLSRPGWHLRTRDVLFASLVLVLFSLTAFSTKLASPVLALGLMVAGVAQCSGANRSRVRSMILLLGGVGAGLGFVLTMVGATTTVGVAKAPITGTLSGAMQFLAMSFGTIAKRLWPLSGLGATVLVLATIALLIERFWRDRDDRMRSLMLLLSMGAWCFVALSVGYARGLSGALVDRYALYSAPFLCGAYAAWRCYPSGQVGAAVRFCIFAVLLASLSYHASDGLRVAKAEKEMEARFFDDVRQGIPLTGIVARHQENWGMNEVGFREGLLTLKAAGIEPFTEIRPDPAMAELSLDPTPAATTGLVLKEGVWQGKGRSGSLTFNLEKPVFAYAVRLKYLLRNNRNSSLLKVSWTRAGRSDPFETVGSEEVLVNFNAAKQRRQEVQTIWIDEEITALRISPSEGAFDFRLDELRLLTRDAAR